MIRKSPPVFALVLAVLTVASGAARACEKCGIPGISHDGGDGFSGSAFPGGGSTGFSGAAAPALSSRPGAAYTMYLNFDGFTFNGAWGNTGLSPGTTPAYFRVDTATTTARIRDTWARIAEKYSSFNVNVTTVDPAIAAGQAATDTIRQAYYDATPRMMHTVIGGNGAWYGNAGGVSYVGVMANSGNITNGYRTNWAFADNLSNGGAKSMAEASAHENGHALGLSHQGDAAPNASEYSTNNGATGNNSYAPIMGVAYSSQKGTWSSGTVRTGTTQQNDVARILQNSGMSLLSSGIGQNFATATSLPVNGTIIDSTLAKGLIRPVQIGGTYNPIGIDNYTKDYFKFTLGTSSTISLTINNGGDWLTPGTALASGSTLRSRLNLFSASDLVTPIGAGLENAGATTVTFTQNLAPGEYYAQITSFGGYQSTYNTQRQYYDMGRYVLTGTGFVVASAVMPEPRAIGLLGVGLIGLCVLKRRRSQTA